MENKKLYAIIYTDPPWPQEKGNARKVRPNQGKELDYSTITLDEIKQVHEPFFTKAAERHNVFMWTIDKYLHDAEQMMAECGYKLHARFIWDKENGIAPAFTVRFSHEYLLWFYLPGRMLMPVKEYRGKYTTVIREASTTHSTKPEAVYIMLESMFPEGNKIELLARQRRGGAGTVGGMKSKTWAIYFKEIFMKERVFVCSCDAMLIVRDDVTKKVLCPLCCDGTVMDEFKAKKGNSNLKTALMNLDVALHDHCELKRRNE